MNQKFRTCLGKLALLICCQLLCLAGCGDAPESSLIYPDVTAIPSSRAAGLGSQLPHFAGSFAGVSGDYYIGQGDIETILDWYDRQANCQETFILGETVFRLYLDGDGEQAEVVIQSLNDKMALISIYKERKPAAEGVSEAALHGAWGAAPTAIPPAQGIVLAERLNVRKGPGTQTLILGKLYQDQKVEIRGRNPTGSWYCMVYQGDPAWISADFIRLETPLKDIPVSDCEAR